MSKIKIENLYFYYDDFLALSNISVVIRPPDHSPDWAIWVWQVYLFALPQPNE